MKLAIQSRSSSSVRIRASLQASAMSRTADNPTARSLCCRVSSTTSGWRWRTRSAVPGASPDRLCTTCGRAPTTRFGGSLSAALRAATSTGPPPATKTRVREGSSRVISGPSTINWRERRHFRAAPVSFDSDPGCAAAETGRCWPANRHLRPGAHAATAPSAGRMISLRRSNPEAAAAERLAAEGGPGVVARLCW